MYKEIPVDRNLLFLSEVLFALDSYTFDSDIIKLLNDLSFLVNKKMFSNYDFENYNVQANDVVLRYLINK